MEDIEGLLGRSRLMRSLAMTSLTTGTETGASKLMKAYKNVMEFTSNMSYGQGDYSFYCTEKLGNVAGNCYSPREAQAIAVYMISNDVLNGVEYTAKDIEEVCTNVVKYNSIHAGPFLSAAMKNVLKKGEKVELNFNRLSKYGPKINFLGMLLLQGDVTIHGDAGNYFGYGLKGAHIIVDGNVKNRPGMCMMSGEIDVSGNVLFGAGDGSIGGTIKIDGSLISVDDTCKADVFHRGKKIAGQEKVPEPFNPLESHIRDLRENS